MLHCENKDKLYNTNGRLFNEPMYCEGLHRPRLRGCLHAVMTFVQFIMWYYILQVSHSVLGTILASVYMLCDVFSYTMSTLLHCGNWEPVMENFLLKLDHAGIFLMVAGNFIPIGILCLHNTGFYMLSAMWAGTIICLFRIFILHQTTWWEPLVIGCASFISIVEMYNIMTPLAFWLTMSSYLMSLVGGLVFAWEYPDPWHDTFGFHEIMHVLTSLASVAVYIANYSVVKQCS